MEDNPAWWDVAISVGGLIGSLVTAVATIFLWKVTRLLASETTRMVDAASQPHIVATLDPSPWSVRLFEMNVNNTGTGTAYDVEIEFDPPLKSEDNLNGTGSPIDKISVLNPGRGINSYVAEYPNVRGVVYAVSVSWKRHPQKAAREKYSYTLDLSNLDNISKIEGDPLVKIAQHLKKIQEDNQKHQHTRSRVQVDAFLAGDRLHETRVARRRARARRLKYAEKVASTPVTDLGKELDM